MMTKRGTRENGKPTSQAVRQTDLVPQSAAPASHRSRDYRGGVREMSDAADHERHRRE